MVDEEKVQLISQIYSLKEAAASVVGIMDNRIYREKDSPRKGYGTWKFPETFTLADAWEKRQVYFLDPEMAKKNFEEFIDNNLFSSVKNKRFSKYDFLVLHQGDLDEIESKIGEKEFDRLWLKLQKKTGYMVLVSGRGMPKIAREKRLRWVSYSALADELLNKSKLELIELLYSLRATSIVEER